MGSKAPSGRGVHNFGIPIHNLWDKKIRNLWDSSIICGTGTASQSDCQFRFQSETGALRQNKHLVDFSLTPVSVSYGTASSFLRFQMRFVNQSIYRMFGVVRDPMVLPAIPPNVVELLDLRTLFLRRRRSSFLFQLILKLKAESQMNQKNPVECPSVSD